MREPHCCEPNLLVHRKTEPGDLRNICFCINQMGRSAPTRGSPRPGCHRRHLQMGATLCGYPILCEAEGGLGQITEPSPLHTPRSIQDHKGGPHPAWLAHRQVDAQSWTWTASCGLLASHALLDEVHPPRPVSLTPGNLEGETDQHPSPRKRWRLNAFHFPSLSKHQVLFKVMRC